MYQINVISNPKEMVTPSYDPPPQVWLDSYDGEPQAIHWEQLHHEITPLGEGVSSFRTSWYAGTGEDVKILTPVFLVEDATANLRTFLLTEWGWTMIPAQESVPELLQQWWSKGGMLANYSGLTFHTRIPSVELQQRGESGDWLPAGERGVPETYRVSVSWAEREGDLVVEITPPVMEDPVILSDLALPVRLLQAVKQRATWKRQTLSVCVEDLLASALRQEGLLPPSKVFVLLPQVEHEVRLLVQQDQIIPAIKLVRKHSLLGLKDAKSYVDTLC